MTQPRQGWRAVLGAGALGALAAFGQAPYDWPVLFVLALMAAIRFYDPAVSPWQSALFGWAFATGYFLHALHWIVSPFMVDAARHGWMAPFALLLLAGGLALFWGVAFWLAHRLSPGARWGLILTIPAAEMLRAYIFTGFPWATPAQAFVDVLPGQMLAWGGPHGMNLMVVAACVAGASFLKPHLNMAARVCAAALAAAALLASLAPVPGPISDTTPYIVRLVQPNATQRDKWDPDKIPVFFDRHLEFTSAAGAEGPPDLVLWSETAIPWLLNRAAPALEQIASAAGASQVALGVQRQAQGRYHNSLVVLDEGGAIAQLYDKHHLVPFGEYMPFADVMSALGLRALADQLGSGYAPGPGPALLDFGPLGRALPLICYEAVFAHDVGAMPERPEFLMQITNDAWFGRGAGPKQHLAQARMRAIEQGLPLARAANTGISAMIDPKGRITTALPLHQAGFVDAALPIALPPTPYAKTGDLPLALVLLLGAAAGHLLRRRV